MKLILSSKSPRRAQILKSHGFDFELVPSNARELTTAPDLAKLPELNAELKAQYVAEQYPRDLCLGADTMILFENEIMGKPQDMPDARRMLRRLRGKTHYVISGVAIINKSAEICEIFSESTAVTFKNFTDTQLEAYLKLVNVSDKAGAYAIQEHGEIIIESFAGDLDNVVGLPIKRVEPILNKYLNR